MGSGLNISMEGDELARKLGGFLPRQSFVLVEGPVGLGKSVVAQRLAYSAVLNEQDTTYISTEIPVASFITQMQSLGYDSRSYLLKQSLKFVSLYSSMYEVNLKSNIIETLLSQKGLMDSQMIVFDAVDDFLINGEFDQEYFFHLITRLRQLANMGKVIVFCVDKEKTDPIFYDMLKRASEVYLSLFEKTIYDNQIKVLKVLRFQGATTDFPDELPFRVRAGMGIVIDISG